MQSTITFDNSNLISYDTFLLYRNLKRERAMEEQSRVGLRDAMASLRAKLEESGFGMLYRGDVAPLGYTMIKPVDDAPPLNP